MEASRPRRVPHYALRTVANTPVEFANTEQDVIRQSFSTGNHTWMKEALPVDLMPDAINILRRHRMERNRLEQPVPQTWSKMTQLWGGGFYPEFLFMPDEYDRKAAIERQSRQASAELRDRISNQDWRHPSQERRLKHESLIHDARLKEPYPYLGGDKDAELQASKMWVRGGPLSSRASSSVQDRFAGTDPCFLAGCGRGLEDDSRSSRMTLPTIVQRLQRRVDADWEGTSVVVSATDQDLVQVAFHMKTVDCERGVTAYMGVLAKDAELVGQLGLRKVSQLWGLRRDFSADMSVSLSDGSTEDPLEHTWTFFLLMPKWVRMRPTDAYYTVHPRAQGSAFRMSSAGSSVLLSLGSAIADPPETARQKVQSARGQGLPKVL